MYRLLFLAALSISIFQSGLLSAQTSPPAGGSAYSGAITAKANSVNLFESGSTLETPKRSQFRAEFAGTALNNTTKKRTIIRAFTLYKKDEVSLEPNSFQQNSATWTEVQTEDYPKEIRSTSAPDPNFPPAGPGGSYFINYHARLTNEILPGNEIDFESGKYKVVVSLYLEDTNGVDISEFGNPHSAGSNILTIF